MIVRLVLAGALLHLLARAGAALGRRRRTSWLILTVLTIVFAADYAGMEAYFLVLRLLPPESAPARARETVYFAVYLLNAVLLALLPALVAAVHLRVKRLRHLAVAVAAVAVASALVGAARGALGSWEALLATTRVLALVGVVAHLAFWAAYFLGWFAEVDAYLAAFVGMFGLYAVLIPVQEVFFELVGMANAAALWHLNIGLLVAFSAVQVVIVLSLSHALGTGRPLRMPRPHPWPGSPRGPRL